MWYWDDITWCISECDNTDCFRNRANMRIKVGLHSFADFKETDECPVWRVKEAEEFIKKST